jgi:hypothetical protein
MKKGAIMMSSSISTARSSASIMILACTLFLGVSGMAYAQGSSSSGQGTRATENPADHSDKKDAIKGHTGEGYPEKSSTEKGREASTMRSSGKEDPADHSDKKDPIRGHTGEGYSGKSSAEKGRDGSTGARPKE